MRQWKTSSRFLLGLVLIGISIVGLSSGQNVVVVDQEEGNDVVETDADPTEENTTTTTTTTSTTWTDTNTSAPSQAPTIMTMPPTSVDGCYTSLDDIFIVIGDDSKLFEPKRFVLCPGTLVEVGFLIPGVGIDKGQRPFVPRSNTEYLCGEDGSSTNNCTISGGDFGLLSVPVFFRQDLTVTNVQVRGFTFVGQMQYASFIAVNGDISFYDCIFRDTSNFGAMVFNFDSSDDFSRRLLLEDEEEDEESFNPWDHALSYVQRYQKGGGTTWSQQQRLVTEDGELADDVDLPSSTRNNHHHHDRDLQTYPDDAMFAGTVKDCLFDNLAPVERELGVEFGIFTVKGPDHRVTIEDSMFSNNHYGNQQLTPIGYAMLFQGCELNLTRVCYVDNDFRGNAVVLLEMTKNPLVEGTQMMTSNYVTTKDADLNCPFAAYFATEDDRRNSNFTCIPAQALECGGDNIPLTERSPAPGPTPVSDGVTAYRWPSCPSLVGMVVFGMYLMAVHGVGSWL